MARYRAANDTPCGAGLQRDIMLKLDACCVRSQRAVVEPYAASMVYRTCFRPTFRKRHVPALGGRAAQLLSRRSTRLAQHIERGGDAVAAAGELYIEDSARTIRADDLVT